MSIKRTVKDLGKTALSKANLSVVRPEYLNEINADQNFLNEYAQALTTAKLPSKNPMELVIFSMDRAMQLHSLLSSFLELVSIKIPVQVLYKATTEAHAQAYEEIKQIFANENVTFVQEVAEVGFKNHLLQILDNVQANKIFFSVDDIIFKNKVDIADWDKYDLHTFVPSLRMGKHLTRSYTYNSAQKPPEFIEGIVEEGKICWIWDGQEYDWGYPLSVDGHIFNLAEIKLLSKNINFKSPNSYEGNIQKYLRFFNKRFGVAAEESMTINLPINRVNTEADNLFGDIDQEFLLKKWQEGYQIDYRALFGVVNESAHQELEINFIKR